MLSLISLQISVQALQNLQGHIAGPDVACCSQTAKQRPGIKTCPGPNINSCPDLIYRKCAQNVIWIFIKQALGIFQGRNVLGIELVLAHEPYPWSKFPSGVDEQGNNDNM
jgi:hypothetical protein